MSTGEARIRSGSRQLMYRVPWRWPCCRREPTGVGVRVPVGIKGGQTHCGTGHRIFHIGPGKLGVRYPVYFVLQLESGNFWSDRFHDS